MTVYLDEPLLVGRPSGSVRSEGGDWPDGVKVMLELLRIPDFSQRIVLQAVGAKGELEADTLVTGEYCFNAVALGWSAVRGKLVLAKNADPRREIAITLPLDM